VFQEIDRVLRPDRYLAIYVCDIWKRNAFVPLGVHLSAMLMSRFLPVDHVTVVRGNKDLDKGNYHKAAEESNFFLRGYNHLLIFKKPSEEQAREARRAEERAKQQPKKPAKAKEGNAGSRPRRKKPNRSGSTTRRPRH